MNIVRLNKRILRFAGVLTLLGTAVSVSYAQTSTGEVEAHNIFGSGFGNNGGGNDPGSGTQPQPSPTPETFQAAFEVGANGKQIKQDCAVCHWLEVHVDGRKLEYGETVTLSKSKTHEVTVKDNPQTRGTPPQGATPPHDDNQTFTVYPIAVGTQEITTIPGTAGDPPKAFLVNDNSVLQYLIENSEKLLAQNRKWPKNVADEPMKKKAHFLPLQLKQSNFPTSTDTTDVDPPTDKSIKLDETGIAYITGTPEMPQLKATFGEGSFSKMTVEWRIEVTTERTERETKDDFHIPATGVIPKNINESWNIPDNYTSPHTYFGGKTSLFYRIKDAAGYLAPETELKIKLRGKNPKDSVAKAHIIATQASYRFAWAMVQHESRQGNRIYNQFNSGGDGPGNLELPNFTGPDGWGIAQLDQPLGASASTEEVFNWQTNVSKFYGELGQKQGFANAYFNILRTIYQPQGKWEEPSDFTRAGTSTQVTALEAAVIVLYNGGAWAVDVKDGEVVYSGRPSQPKVSGTTRYLSCWEFHPNNALGSRWEFHENTRNPAYLHDVLYNEFEGNATNQE